MKMRIYKSTAKEVAEFLCKEAFKERIQESHNKSLKLAERVYIRLVPKATYERVVVAPDAFLTFSKDLLKFLGQEIGKEVFEARVVTGIEEFDSRPFLALKKPKPIPVSDYTISFNRKDAQTLRDAILEAAEERVELMTEYQAVFDSLKRLLLKVGSTVKFNNNQYLRRVLEAYFAGADMSVAGKMPKGAMKLLLDLAR